ncbi:MAG TPA: discoidin domain-containing protein [Polyangiaceae bacterium]
MRMLRLGAFTIASFVLVACAASAVQSGDDTSGGPGTDGGSSSGDASNGGEGGSGNPGEGGAPVEAGVAEYPSLKASTGWQVYPDGSYHYGPSILVESDGTIRMYTCSPGTNGAWDYIRYHQSNDGGHTWSADSVVLEPTAGSVDAYSTCDPGVVKVGAYYYVGYTSTTNSAGTQNDVFIARSTSPTGPFDKWNGTGWGGNPTALITYPGASTYYGYGEPSLVLQGKKLFVYYSDDQAVQYTNVATVDDATVDDWPKHLVDHGHAIERTRAGQDSADVKFDDALNAFVAVTTMDRFGPNATIAAYQSTDGLTFTPIPYVGARAQTGAHNVGISGDVTGHITKSIPLFVGYAYQPPPNGWGNWPTFVDPITIDPSTHAVPVAGAVSSIVGTTDWNWSGPKAWDGDPTTVFSSVSHAATDAAEEWVWVDLGATQSVTGVSVVPRASGLGFPVDFTIQTSTDGATFTVVPGATFTGYANPGSTTAAITFGALVSARYVKLDATRLGADDSGNHYLQLSEITPQIAP